MAFRHLSESHSAERSAAATEWMRIFAVATNRACRDAQNYSADISAITADWRAEFGRVRANSSTDLLLGVLPGAPIVTVESASNLIGRRIREQSHRPLQGAYRRCCQPAHRSRHPATTQRRPPALPSIRSHRCARPVHRARTSTRQPDRRHSIRPPQPGRAATASRSASTITAKVTGSPAGVVMRRRRKPQNQREWVAQVPYSAHPANSERRALLRPRPHSTALESTSHTLSFQLGPPRASAATTWLVKVSARRSHLLKHSRFGRYGNHGRRCACV